MSEMDLQRTKIFDDPTRPARNKRECPKLDGIVTHVPANFIASILTPKGRTHEAIRFGSAVIRAPDVKQAELVCTYLSAAHRKHTRIYSLIDTRPFEIASIGAPLPDTGPLMAAQGGPFAKVYRLIERAKGGTGRWELRPVAVFITAEAKRAAPYNAAIVSIPRAASGRALRLKVWHSLAEGDGSAVGGVVRV